MTHSKNAPASLPLRPWQLRALRRIGMWLAGISVAVFALGFLMAYSDGWRLLARMEEWDDKLQALDQVREAQPAGIIQHFGGPGSVDYVLHSGRSWQDRARIDRLYREAIGEVSPSSPPDPYRYETPDNAVATPATIRAIAELRPALRAEMNYPARSYLQRYSGICSDLMLLLAGLAVVLALRARSIAPPQLLATPIHLPGQPPPLPAIETQRSAVAKFRRLIWIVPALHAIALAGAIYCCCGRCPLEAIDTSYTLQLSLYDLHTSLDAEHKLQDQIAKSAEAAPGADAGTANLRAQLARQQITSASLINTILSEAMSHDYKEVIAEVEILAKAYKAYAKSPAIPVPPDSAAAVQAPLGRIQKTVMESLEHGNSGIFLMFMPVSILFFVGIPCGIALIVLERALMRLQWARAAVKSGSLDRLRALRRRVHAKQTEQALPAIPRPA